MARLLIAEDSPSQAREIQFLLEDAAFEVELCANGARALEAITAARLAQVSEVVNA